MKNVARLLVRDLKRLAKTPPAWLVVIFLAVLPSLYTWFNVVGFWDPYDNTGNLRVCVVNEDAGAQSEELGELHLGDQIVEKLKQNDQMGWDFTTSEQAQEDVRAGSAYAAFVIPENFSENVTTLLSGDFEQPVLQYYVNEKVGPVAPKITDTGANELDATINEAFVSTVSETLVAQIDAKLDESERSLLTAKSTALKRVVKARDGVAKVRKSIAGLSDSAQETIGDIATAKEGLAGAKAQIDLLATGLGQVSTLSGNANSSLISFAGNAQDTLDAGSAQIAQASARTSTTIAKDANALLSAKGNVDGAIARGQAIVQDNQQILDALKRLQDSLPDKAQITQITDAIAKVDAANARTKGNLDGLARLSDDVGTMATSTSDAATSTNQALQETLAAGDGFRSTLNAQTLPAISGALASTAQVTSQLASDTASQKLLVNQAISALDELSSTLGTTQDALGKTAEMLVSLEGELNGLATDLTTLGTSSAIAELIGTDRIDPQTAADFMMSPTTLKTEELYPLNAYGSAMAPLFMNLTLWIGVFMLMVIIRLEVDEEGIEGLTVTQRFFGRHLFLAPIAIAQAAICCTGCLALGVQCASIPALYVTAIVASLTYLSVQYALSTTLQHVGKAICIILVFVQIPGATGLYPIEMTPAFFHVVYPLFPFTYGINAMREAISGFYDGQWAAYLGILLAFQIAFLLAGALVRPYLTNLNRMFARQIEESDLVNGESVELPARRWRMSHVLRALADRDEYRIALEQRTHRFMKLYPQLQLVAVVTSILALVLATAILALVHADKVIILTSWLGWFIVVATFFIIVEFVRDSLSHQISLEEMSDSEVRTLYEGKNAFTRVKPLVRDVMAPVEAAEVHGTAPAQAMQGASAAQAVPASPAMPALPAQLAHDAPRRPAATAPHVAPVVEPLADVADVADVADEGAAEGGAAR